MCTRPITMFNEAKGEEVTVSCRTCDECVATRRRGWVARAMAEKALHPQTFAVTLTYHDETEFTRDGARFFRYDDVRLFLAGLRRQIAYHTQETAALRFIAAGEQGSRNGRCHWHVILYSDVDLLTIGEFSAPWGVVTAESDIVAPPGKDMPRNWSMWPHGFVQVQRPDAGGMHYALSYALKDQFSVAKSEGSNRISRAEQFATGVFRMSKSPPIGAGFIDAAIYDCYSGGYVLPKLQLQIPEWRGYWVPTGILRKRLLEGMRRVNASLEAQHGRSANQWRPLVLSLQENEGDLEALGVIPESDPDEEQIETKVKRAAKEAAAANTIREIVRTCGGSLPCLQCCRGLPDQELWSFGVRFKEAGSSVLEAFTVAGQAKLNEQGYRNKSNGINRACQLRDTASRKRAFPRSAGV